MADVAVVHIASASLGGAPLRSFAESYRRCPAGVDHSLVVFFNGNGSPEAARGLQAELADVRYEPIFSSEAMIDMAAYRLVARTVSERYLCLLNSTSVVLQEGWLASFLRYVERERVGIVGASGSWESHYTQSRRRSVSSFRRGSGALDVPRAAYRKAHAVYATSRGFPPFPNYHIRATAFVISRELFLELSERPLRTKYDAWMLESGKHGLTRQIFAAGLDALVIGRDGIAYPKERWPESCTFRSQGQPNLVVADRRTADYSAASPAQRRSLSRAAWGDATR